MKRNESAENYLEAILVIQKTKGNVRSIDVAHELSFSKPSVSIAMKNFREKGFVTIDSEGFISLTPSGLAIAESVYERHTVIANALITLGVDKETAFEDSCKIEHDISEISFKKIKDYFEKITNK